MTLSVFNVGFQKAIQKIAQIPSSFAILETSQILDNNLNLKREVLPGWGDGHPAASVNISLKLYA